MPNFMQAYMFTIKKINTYNKYKIIIYNKYNRKIEMGLIQFSWEENEQIWYIEVPKLKNWEYYCDYNYIIQNFAKKQ